MVGRWLTIVGVSAGLAACGTSSDTPDVPIATLDLGQGPYSGEITVSFTIADPQSRLVNAVVYAGAAANPQTVATAASTSPSLLGLESSPAGVGHTFVWDSAAELGYVSAPAVYVRIAISSGPAVGIGDEAGPIAIDNTTLPRFYSAAGSVRRSPTLLGAPTADLAGKLYIGLFQDSISCPPICTSVAIADLGTQDFSNTAIAVPYSFTHVPHGTYKVVAVLDHNDNALVGPCLVDPGDLVNATDMTLVLEADLLARDVIINYGSTQACP